PPVKMAEKMRPPLLEKLTFVNNAEATLRRVTFRFSNDPQSTLSVTGIELNATRLNVASALFTNVSFSSNGGLIFSAIFTGGSDFNTNPTTTAFNNAIERLSRAQNALDAQSSSFSSSSQIVRTRSEFNTQYANSLKSAADQLVAANIDEEAAKAVALQTRFQLGVQALASSGRSSQYVLALFTNR
ncbi:MAG: hypothetical protein AAF403_01270, partial [Pseudomonadota bacterium]